ncbi:MAG TPA: ABC transporter ATP-binding protein [bacterium]|nr:ABC transporter ATP-binding protein [bacterium]
MSTVDTAPVLVVEGLRKRYGSTAALDGLSFAVHPGEVYGLLGPNGAGKSTCIGAVAGLVQPDAGSITLRGASLKDNPRVYKQGLGVVPQEVALFDQLTGRENLAYFGKLYRVDGPTLRSRIVETLELLGLTADADRPLGAYSGGMKRRINIGASLLHRPPVLLLDEPTVGVDPQTRNHLFDLVERLQGEGFALLYTTHYMEEAERLCDRIGVVDHGKLIAEGTLRELLWQGPDEELVELSVENGTTPGELLERLPASLTPFQPDYGEGLLRLHLRDAGPALPAILADLAAAGITVQGLQVRRPNLERLFLHLTGRALRE